MSAATETLLALAIYNSWRRGDETIEMPAPAEIGATIDDAVNLLRKYDDLKARAERAEAELAGIRALADRRNKRYHVEDTTHQLVVALDQALDIAQAQLAAERARLDYILRTCAAGVFYNAESRAAIDAAMKEGSV